MAFALATPVTAWRGPGLAAASAALTATILVDSSSTLPLWLPIALAVGIAGLAALRRTPWAVAPLLPLLTYFGGGWFALGGWTLAGISIPYAWELFRRSESTKQRDIRESVKLYRHEVGILRRHLDRYPLLLQTCTALSQARNGDELAAILLPVSQSLVPEWCGGRVYLGTSDAPELILSAGDVGLDDYDLVVYATQEDRSAVRRHGDKVLIVLPLRSERRMSTHSVDGHRGALCVVATSRGTEDVLVIDLLRALARLGGLGLAAVDLVNQAQALALHDDLTGLFGRHEYFRRLEELLAQSEREKLHVGVIMCDMDHLKLYNDNWGHAAGDEALRAVAQAIRDHLPARAAACRYGGEEFAIMIPPAYAAGTQSIAENIRVAIRSLHPLADHPEVGISASLGWALSEENESAEALMKRADTACYRAKDHGRDRVEASV